MVRFTAQTTRTEPSLRSAVLKDSTWKAHLGNSKHLPGLANTSTWKAQLGISKHLPGLTDTSTGKTQLGTLKHLPGLTDTSTWKAQLGISKHRPGLADTSTWKAQLGISKHLPGLADTSTWKARRRGSASKTGSGVVVNRSVSVSIVNKADSGSLSHRSGVRGQRGHQIQMVKWVMVCYLLTRQPETRFLVSQANSATLRPTQPPTLSGT